MADIFESYTTGLESPATHLVAVVPSDTTDLDQASRALNTATSGTVQITTVSGTIATVFVNAGTTFPVRATRIWQTGTTATNIVAMY
ncbi:spike base protein, RCAP_Rcc01079 family [Algirhabdus cladophorae]|uniref:spike base protein, RCAP_Rcc01079 family n=1 Tax=Algirhabdus cladophorae TaxID=3377108 RepID=UPI003B8483A7